MKNYFSHLLLLGWATAIDYYHVVLKAAARVLTGNIERVLISPKLDSLQFSLLNPESNLILHIQGPE